MSHKAEDWATKPFRTSQLTPKRTPVVPYLPKGLLVEPPTGRPSRPLDETEVVDDNSPVLRRSAKNFYIHVEKSSQTSDATNPAAEASSYAAEPRPSMAIPTRNQREGEAKRPRLSIRILAEQHKRKIDRTLPQGSIATMKKRSTKLWGSKPESLGNNQATDVPGSLDHPTTFKWVRGELISQDIYGRVYLALNATTGEMISVKQVEKPQTAVDKAESKQLAAIQALQLESEMLRDLDHPNILRYLGFEETPLTMSIFFEFVSEVTIESCLLKHGRFKDTVTRSFSGQILGGLEYLHSNGVVHRNLQGSNMLVEHTGVCKISNFGMSKRAEEFLGDAQGDAQVSCYWPPPEIIDSQNNKYNSKIDIWSVGCIVLEMWSGKRPWNGEEMFAVIFNLYQSRQPPPVPKEVVLSSEAEDFGRKCLAVNPSERPSAQELRQHSYLVTPPNWRFTGFA